MNKKIYTSLLCVIFVIVLYIYWYYTKIGYCKKLYQKLKQFKGFEHFHLPNQPKEEPQLKPITNTNCHTLFYGTSGSGKTSFLKFYLEQTISNFIVFGRDETEFSDNYVSLLQLENINIELLAIKTINLDDVGAFKQLRTKVEHLFRFRWHHNIQVIYLAHYANDFLSVVRENCFKLYITINDPDSFFETIVSTYRINKLNWKPYRSQLEFGVIEFDTRSQKYKILNQKYQVVYDTTKHKWSPEDYVKYEGYFFTGEKYNRLKVFLEKMSFQTIEITPFNVAYYYVYYCIQNKIKVNDPKIDNYIERRMQQPLFSDQFKEAFKNKIIEQATRYTKSWNFNRYFEFFNIYFFISKFLYKSIFSKMGLIS